jgi:hypothetical protein
MSLGCRPPSALGMRGAAYGTRREPAKTWSMAHKGDQTLLMWNDFWTAAYQAIDN